MIIDDFRLHHSSTSELAVEAFSRAVHGLVSHRSLSTALADALRLDPGLVSAHVLNGFAGVIMARAETIAAARAAHTRALEALTAVGGGTPCETALTLALGDATRGRFSAAAERLEEHVRRQPGALLCFKIAQALRFMSGTRTAMLRASSEALTAWPDDASGRGFVLGCHAFALEECGDFAAAETAGRSALELEPGDAWGLHAVAHVMEMTGRTAAGMSWLGATRRNWTGCGSFGLHLDWHLALFHLAEGDLNRALAIYDAHLVTTLASDFRDVANAASLLWRLEQQGADVADRWDAVADVAEARRRDVSYVFASLHHVLALLGAGRIASAVDVLEALGANATYGIGDQATVAASVGEPLARTLLEMATGDVDTRRLFELARRLPDIGGSHAQRDVFVRSLVLAAVEAGDAKAAADLSRLRHALHEPDSFTRLAARRTARTRQRHSAVGRAEPAQVM